MVSRYSKTCCCSHADSHTDYRQWAKETLKLKGKEGGREGGGGGGEERERERECMCVCA